MNTLLEFLRTPVLFLGYALVPVASLFVLLTAIRIFRKQSPGKAVLASLADALVIASLTGILILALGPNPGVDTSVNLQPLRGITSSSGWSDLGLALVNLAGNLGIFAVLGGALALRFRDAPIGAALAVSLALFSVALELAQYVLNNGRSSDIDDVLMNVLGGTLGFAAGRWVIRLLGSDAHAAGALPMEVADRRATT